MPDTHHLATLQANNPDVAAYVVFDGSGNVEASGSFDEHLEQAAVAMLTPLRDLLDRSGAELGCGEVRTCVLEGTEGSIALADVDGVRAVAVLGARGAAMGSLVADARWLAGELARGARAA